MPSSAPAPAATPPRSTRPISACRSRSIDAEKNPGGVCLYRGCIPSKALLHVAKVIDEARHARAWGVTFGEPKIDVDKLRAFKEGVVDKLTGGVGQVGRAAQGELPPGPRDAHRSAIADDRRRWHGDSAAVRARVLATGSHPARVPSLVARQPARDGFDSALDLPDIPKSLLVVGGGYIGLELGTVYAALGSKVTVVEMTPGLLPGADRDLVNILQKRLEKLFAAIMLNTKVLNVAEASDGHPRHVRRRRDAARSRRSTACSSRSAAGRTRRFPASTPHA